MPRGAITETCLQEIVDRIVARYAPRQIILFGSYAYGTPDAHSDLDLFIVKETADAPDERRMQVWRLLEDLDLDVHVSPFVYTPQELRKRLAIRDFFVREILEKGKVLFGEDWQVEPPVKDEGPMEQAMEWFDRADGDFRTAARILDERALRPNAAFHIAQGIEKYLKGYLILHDQKPPRSHELPALLKLACRFQRQWSRAYGKLCRQAMEYYEDRYPPGRPRDYEADQLRDALARAQELGRSIRAEASQSL